MTRYTLFLCTISAILGGAVSALLIAGPELQPSSSAQEPGFRPLPGPGLRGTAPPGEYPPIEAPAAPRTATAPLQPLSAEDDELTAEERVNVAVYESANRSVVNINTRTVQTNRLLFLEVPSEGEGSGTVIDRQGHVLTNFHVIDGAREMQVTLFNGKTYEARLVGQDPATDVAVLKIEAPAELLHPVPFGDSTRLRVGQRVFAIGNPFGLERTLTTGIISSLNRSLPARRSGRTIKSIIQIDAAINPGNSGGPLIDTRGRMIGMNTAIASKTGESAGVGFAIPIGTVARVVPQLIAQGRVVRPDLGIARVYQTEHGLLIARLLPDGAAARAGLKGPQIVRQRRRQGPFVYEYETIDRSAADLIVGVDGKRVKTAEDLLEAIDSKSPGDRVVITVVRDGQEVPVEVTLDEDE